MVKIIAAGLAVKAKDTGRVLLLQRAVTPRDPASGKLEFPGGHVEPGETPLVAAKREWSEETGTTLPRGSVTNAWKSGIYKGYVYEVDKESQVKINLPSGQRKVVNPDDPDQDWIETVLWLSPDQLPGNSLLRDELRKAMRLVMQAIRQQWTTEQRYADRLDGLQQVRRKQASFSAVLSPLLRDVFTGM